MPTYYIMDPDSAWPKPSPHEMPAPAEIAAYRWLTDTELAVYAANIAHRIPGRPAMVSPRHRGVDTGELQLFAGRTIDVPAMFIAGPAIGAPIRPPARSSACRHRLLRMHDVHLIEGAGHWVQQEQPARVSEALLHLLNR